MRTLSVFIALLVAGSPVTLARQGHEMPANLAGRGTPASPILFSDLGTHHRAITTKVEGAQKYFDQGLRLMYAFNLDEAQRSFEEAARLDPTCAMAQWGIAMALGPNINLPSMPDRAKAGFDAAQRAGTLSTGCSEVEKALIDAVARRYAATPPEKSEAQAILDQAYADAMREVFKKFPSDPDVGAFFAESMMTLRPWDLWTKDGQPHPGTEEIVATLEAVLAAHPDHPGANHYYIHAVEASPHPEKALAAADKLPGLMPGAGHMVHMPSHIYMRMGRYEAACEANRKAIEVDKKYLAAVGGPPGFYGMYAAHNYQFLSAAAAMAGRSKEAVQSARDMLALIPPEMFAQMPEMDGALAQPILMLVRFGQWDATLTEPEFPKDAKFPAALRLYARGMAYAGKGEMELAQQELERLILAVEATPEDVKKYQNSARTLLRIARHTLQGRMAAVEQRYEVAVQNLKVAATLEDGLRYDEPPNWYAPVRQALGATLVAAARYDEAEAVFKEDLARNPENGWSLYGISRALRVQEKDDDARPFETRLKEAWKTADVKLKAAWY